MRILGTLLTSILFCISLHSQTMQIGISGGLSGYAGDLDSPELTRNLQNALPAFGITIKNTLSPRIAFRGNLMIGKIQGDDALSNKDWQLDRNLKFKSNLVEVAGLFEFNLFKFGDEDKRWTPYFAAGAAFFHHNPTAELSGVRYNLQPLGTEGQGIVGEADPYNLNMLTIPMGGGIKFKLSDKITLQAEFLSRFTFNDYLDDVSGEYVDYNTLLNGNGITAAQLSQGGKNCEAGAVCLPGGSQRGTPDVDDYYYTGMFTILFNIGEINTGNSGEGCYQF